MGTNSIWLVFFLKGEIWIYRQAHTKGERRFSLLTPSLEFYLGDISDPAGPAFSSHSFPAGKEWGTLGSYCFLKKFYLFFNWRIIALQNFVVFYQTSRWISHRSSACGAYIPSALQQDVHLADHFLWTLEATHHWLPHWLSWIQTFPSPRKQKRLILTYCTQSFQGMGFDILKA